MKIFTHEFKSFIKGFVFCSWRGHKGKWKEYYWAIGHWGGYRKFCQRCGQPISTHEEEKKYFEKHFKKR